VSEDLKGGAHCIPEGIVTDILSESQEGRRKSFSVAGTTAGFYLGTYSTQVRALLLQHHAWGNKMRTQYESLRQIHHELTYLMMMIIIIIVLSIG
jgi:hypothetical protein